MHHPLSVDIVEAVADAKGVDPAELDYVLQDHIDVDSLDRLLAHDSTNWTLSFELPDCEVLVTSEGNVVISELQPSA